MNGLGLLEAGTFRIAAAVALKAIELAHTAISKKTNGSGSPINELVDGEKRIVTQLSEMNGHMQTLVSNQDHHFSKLTEISVGLVQMQRDVLTMKRNDGAGG